MIVNAVSNVITDELFDPSTRRNKVLSALFMLAAAMFLFYPLVGYLGTFFIIFTYFGMVMPKRRPLVVVSALWLGLYTPMIAFLLVLDAAIRNDVALSDVLSSPSLLVSAPSKAITLFCIGLLAVPANSVIPMLAGRSLRSAWFSPASRGHALPRILSSLAFVAIASGVLVFFNQEIGHRHAELIRHNASLDETQALIDALKKTNPGADLGEAEFLLRRQSAEFAGYGQRPYYQSYDAYKAYMSGSKPKAASEN